MPECSKLEGENYFLYFFHSFFVGGGDAHLSPFCVAFDEDSNKSYCFLLFKAFLVVYRPPAETDIS